MAENSQEQSEISEETTCSAAQKQPKLCDACKTAGREAAQIAELNVANCCYQLDYVLKVLDVVDLGKIQLQTRKELRKKVKKIMEKIDM